MRMSIWVTLTALIVLLLLSPQRVWGQDDQVEYQLKAAFLYHFTKFVTWPEQEAEVEGIVKIGILGEDPFSQSLEAVFIESPADGRQYEIIRSNETIDVLDCQIVFINLQDSATISRAIKHLRDHPVLTVGETMGFARLGGMIGFVVEDNKVRFEINLRASEEAELAINSRMLALANIVETKSRD